VIIKITKLRRGGVIGEGRSYRRGEELSGRGGVIGPFIHYAIRVNILSLRLGSGLPSIPTAVRYQILLPEK